MTSYIPFQLVYPMILSMNSRVTPDFCQSHNNSKEVPGHLGYSHHSFVGLWLQKLVCLKYASSMGFGWIFDLYPFVCFLTKEFAPWMKLFKIPTRVALAVPSFSSYQ